MRIQAASDFESNGIPQSNSVNGGAFASLSTARRSLIALRTRKVQEYHAIIMFYSMIQCIIRPSFLTECLECLTSWLLFE
jgi:hypothetical protein